MIRSYLVRVTVEGYLRSPSDKGKGNEPSQPNTITWCVLSFCCYHSLSIAVRYDSHRNEDLLNKRLWTKQKATKKGKRNMFRYITREADIAYIIVVCER